MNPHSTTFTDYIVYRYEETAGSVFNDHILVTAGRIGVHHEIGQAVTAEMVRAALEKERLGNGGLTAGDYRVMPQPGRFGIVFDVTVESTIRIDGLSAETAQQGGTGSV